MNIDFKTKYENSEIMQQGVAIILASDQYTETYKEMIRDYLGWTDLNNIQVTTSITENVSTLYAGDSTKNEKIGISKSKVNKNGFTLNTTKGGTVGNIEKPIYIEDELTKAVDVIVDELIKTPPTEKLETIAKSKYDAKVKELGIKIDELAKQTEALNKTLSLIDQLKSQIETLNQTVDSEKILTSVANNETQASNDRYSSLLSDFQTALTKGIEEAIERVSLEAQVRGLQAQKEVLQQQLKDLETVVKNLQLTQTELLQTIQSKDEAAAAALILTGPPGSFRQTTNVGWKIPESNITKPKELLNGNVLKFESWRTFHIWPNGNVIDFYNLKSDQSITITFSYAVDTGGHNSPWIGGPTSLSIDPRVGKVAGKVTANFTKIRNINSPKGRGKNFDDTISVTTSLGDTFAIKARMWRKLRKGGSGN